MIIKPSPQYAPGSVTYQRSGSDLIIDGETVTPENLGNADQQATNHPMILHVDGSTITVLAYQPADQMSWFPEPFELADGDSVTYSHD